jgi:aspartate/methionine/tyrosine aminotransferase
MRVPPFKLDAWLAAHDFAVPPIRFNLASSTGPTWTLGELMRLGNGLAPLADLRMSYAPSEGAKLLRERIAQLHDVDPAHVLVMTGASECLVALSAHFAAAGASIVLPRPAYPAVPVLARAWGMQVREYALDPARGFAQTADLVLDAVDASTRVVFVNSPHNPTGAVMPEIEQRRLAEALAARGIPLIIDEVYHPLYFGGAAPTATQLPNTIVLGDFAKALSIPGLRIGWLIDRDADRRASLLDLRSYFTISNSPLAEAIGAHVLENASAVLARVEKTAKANLVLLTAFMQQQKKLAWAPPSGGTTCFPWFSDGRDSRSFSEDLAHAGVLVAPGDCFDMPAHMRVGFGALASGYDEALAIFANALAAA